MHIDMYHSHPPSVLISIARSAMAYIPECQHCILLSRSAMT